MSRNNSPRVSSPASSKRGSMTPKISSPIDSILRISQNASMFVESVSPLTASGQYRKIQNEETMPEDTTVIPLDDRQTTEPQYQQHQQQQQQQYQQQQGQNNTFIQPSNYASAQADAQVTTVDPILEPIGTRTWLYIFIMQMLGSYIINFGACFGIAYAMYNNEPNNLVFLASGLTSIVADVAVTAFVIPLACVLIGTVLVKQDLRMGKLVKPIDKRWLNLRIFRAIPTDQRWRWLLPRALVIGFYFFLIFFPFSILILWAAHPDGMQAQWNYIAFKGYWGGLEGALCMPLIAFIPMCTKDVKQVPLAVHSNAQPRGTMAV